MLLSSVFGQHYHAYALKHEIHYDLQILGDILTYHPGPLVEHQKIRSILFDSIRNHLPDSLEIRAFRNVVRDVLKLTHCGHTDVQLPKKYLRRFFFSSPPRIPFILLADDTAAYVYGVHKSLIGILNFGDTILSINGKSIMQILNETQHYFTYDGFIYSSAKFHAGRLMQSTLPVLFQFPTRYVLVRMKNGKTDTIMTEAIRSRLTVSYRLFRLKDDTLKRTGKKSGIAYYIHKDAMNSWAYLKIQSFMGRGINKGLKKFFKESKTCSNLIIDLCNNPGGKVLHAEKLYYSLFPSDTEKYFFFRRDHSKPPYQYVNFALPYRLLNFGLQFFFKKKVQHDTIFYYRKKTRSLPFKGKFERIYVLTNYGTFSAASFLAERFQRNTNCILVGTETGGTRVGCNAVALYPCVLPKSKLKIFLPAYRFNHHGKLISDDGRGVMPTYEVHGSYIDVFRGRNKLFEFVLEKINSEKK
ncbi:MAG: S41 family peptidase [Bacteroidia bacterium]|nr:S41 family peptidase [Bacteroidia bacterium]